MKTALIALATYARGASAISVASSSVGDGAMVVSDEDATRTCPGGLRQLRTVALPYLQFNASKGDGSDTKDKDGHSQPWSPHRAKDKYVLKFRVVEVSPKKKPSLGFGPKLYAGYRYLLFDEDRKWGLVGQGCVVEGKVRCKKPSGGAALTVEAGANATNAGAKACGTPCEQDVHWPQLQYVRGVLGGAGTALAATKGKDYKQGSAAMIGVGAGTMTEWLLSSYGQMAVDAVDVEGAVMSAAFDCFGLGHTPNSKARLNTHVEDGIEFLQRQPAEKYDVVLLDVTPVPTHFAANVALIHERMAPGAVLALNGWTYDPRWSSFVQDLAHHFPAVYKTRVGMGNELVFTAKSKTPNGGSPFPENFPGDLSAVPAEDAKWFKEFRWGKVNAK
jgi:hypothetical protein